MGARIVVVGDGPELVLPGLWAPSVPQSWTAGEGVLDGHRLGLRLSLENGRSQPVASGYERDCLADLTACLRVDVAPLEGGGWVVAQGNSTHVVVLDSTGKVLRLIDVRSPKFRRDGRTPKETTEGQLDWGTTNSTLWGLYAWSDRIAVVHSRNATREWQRGQVMQFDVFMNILAVNGDRLVSDIRLPGLPVGFDSGQILAIDYGPAGRRHDASEVTLARISLLGIPSERPQE